MTYLVFCTFDLKNATSIDYQNAYNDLAGIGLKKVIKGDSSKDAVIPTTAAIGQFNGNSVGEVRDGITEKVRVAFSRRGFKSEIFLVAGGDWAWGAQTT